MNGLKTIYFTRKGFEKLRSRVQAIEKKVDDLGIEMGRAADLGDIWENSEYDCARFDRDQATSRLNELKHAMAVAHIVDANDISTEYIMFGVTVVLEDPKNGKDIEYTIVGPYETDSSGTYISYLSPTAQGIMGKRIGEFAEIKTSSGHILYRIKGIFLRKE